MGKREIIAMTGQRLPRERWTVRSPESCTAADARADASAGGAGAAKGGA